MKDTAAGVRGNARIPLSSAADPVRLCRGGAGARGWRQGAPWARGWRERPRLDKTPVPVLSRDTIAGENSDTGPGLQLLRKPFLKTRDDSKNELWQGCVGVCFRTSLVLWGVFLWVHGECVF